MSLPELVSRCKKKDRKAQEMLYTMYSARFFGLCLKYSSSFEQAKDNLQEGFIKILENIDKFKGKGSFEGWMTRTIINTCLSEYQSKIFFTELEADKLEEPEIEILRRPIDVGFLNQLIEELPDQYRIVFNLYVFEGYTHAEIAAELRISIGTSKSNLSRARKHLKTRIEKSEISVKETEK